MFLKTKRPYILFVNDILNDGIGDLGHLVDMASSENLKILSESLPFTISLEAKSEDKKNFTPLYLICCEDKPDNVKRVIEILFENSIITSSVIPTTSQPLQSNVHLVLYDFKTVAKDAKKQFELDEKQKRELVYSDNEEDQPKLPSCNYSVVKHRYENDQMGKLIDNYILSQPTLVEQLQKVSGIEFVSNKLSIPTLNKLPVLQTLLGEHGKSEVNDPSSRSMGFNLKYDHGILIKPHTCRTLNEKAEQLIKLSDKNYLKALVEKEEGIHVDDALQLLHQTLFIPGYFQNVMANSIFINSLAVSSEAKKYKDIVFHVNAKVFKKEYLKQKLLAKHGIATIEIISPDNMEIIKVSEASGKQRLRIFSGFMLNNSDYQSLYKIAQTFGGCSGDKSFEMVISNGLIPFYEAREWKRGFVNALARFAKHSEVSDSVLSFINSFQNLESCHTAEIEKQSAEISAFISDEFINHWRSLIEVIRDKFNYYNKLPRFILETVSYSLIAESFYDKNYAQARELINLNKDKKQYILFIFDKYKEKHEYEIMSYIYYLIPPIAKELSLDSNVQSAIEYYIYKNNYTQFQSTLFKSNQKLKSEDYFASIARDQLLTILRNEIVFSSYRNNDQDLLPAKIKLLLDENMSEQDKFIKCIDLLNEYKTENKSDFANDFAHSLQRQRNDNVVMSLYFQIPDEKDSQDFSFSAFANKKMKSAAPPFK